MFLYCFILDNTFVMLKNIALTLFAVVMGMSWIILVKDREIEYNAAKTVHLEESYSIEVEANEEYDL